MMKQRGPADEAFPVDRLASDSFGSHIARMLGGDAPSVHSPRVNITETDHEVRLEMEVPGFAKQDLKVEMAGDTLTIRGEHSEEHHRQDAQFTRREFNHASFERSFVLPGGAAADKIRADHTDGVLTLTIPKTGAARAPVRHIAIP